LGVHVLGFADTVPTKVIKTKIARCVRRLLEERAIRLPSHVSAVSELFTKHAKGLYKVRFFRGSYFDQKRGREVDTSVENSPLYEPLREIGFDTAAIRRIIARFPVKLLQKWTDVTLAAVESKKIKESPPAYFMHYIQEAAAGRATPPDWYRILDRQEQDQQQAESEKAALADSEDAFEQYRSGEARDSFDRVMQRVFQGLRHAGRPDSEAREQAEYMARVHLRQQFYREHPQADGARMTRLGDLL
jgi:hypothetical protein